MITRSLTAWITPFTALGSLDDAIARVKDLAASVHATPNLLLPTHFGPWPQSQCRQSLPADMRVGSADDLAAIRQKVEGAGVGFGAWGVPVDESSAELAAAFAAAAGYYALNIEPAEFWTPGDSPQAVDAWWTRFWNALPDQDALSGNVCATVVPDRWGLDSFSQSLPNIAAGCGALALEVYGGVQTAGSYPFPTLWPTQSFAEIRARGVEANLIPIVALDNLHAQASLAARLGHGQIQVWCI